MKPYLLFCFDSYYPGGGFEDFVGDFDSLEEAQARFEGRMDYAACDNCEIILIPGKDGEDWSRVARGQWRREYVTGEKPNPASHFRAEWD